MYTIFLSTLAAMKGGRYIIYIFVPVLASLFGLLCWNCARMYVFEKKNIREQVETLINDVSYKIQWHNGSQISNFALMMTDKDYDSKVSFAAGFTHNKGKMMKMFFDDDTLAPMSPGADSNIIDPTFLTKNNIKFKPSAMMTMKQFDSLFKIELRKNGLNVNYTISKVRYTDTAKLKDVIVSPPFIIDFFSPRMYNLYYSIPASLVLGNMLPYLASNLLLCALLIFGTIFYYRSYRLQLQMYEFRESLFGNITHELKTPLSSMQLIIDDAKKHIGGSDTVSIPARHVQFADSELSRMKLIVENILSFRKMGHKQFAFNQEIVDLDNVIGEAIKVMEIKAAKVNGVISYMPGNKIKIPGNPALLTNMLTALIDNALKYSERAPVIDITLTGSAGNAAISVKDNGAGIPPEYIKKIFEPFFRMPSGNVYTIAGHGLGLSFVKQVADLHKGRVKVISNNSGTTFDLTFSNPRL